MYYDRLSDLGIKLSRRSGSEKTKCPQCSDGRKNKTDKPLSVNITTGEYKCHHCGWAGNVRSFERKRENKKYEKPNSDVLKSIDLRKQVIEWFGKRMIGEETLNKFMVYCKEEFMPQTNKKENCICFPYFRDGELINVKYRDARKNFKMVKDAELILYNLPSIGENKKAIIVEGEIDCMSLYEAGFGKVYEEKEIVDEKTGEATKEENWLNGWAILSVPNGASNGNQRMEYLDNCSEYLMGLHEIVIATDGDAAGLNLKDELTRRLGVERCKVVSYPIEEVVLLDTGRKRRCKDFNEVLVHFGRETIISCVENSQQIPVDGVHYLEDIFPSMIENFRNGIQLAPKTHFTDMDEFFRWKKGEINLIVGYANHGKSFFILQLMLTKSIFDDWTWAIFSPENYPANDFYDDLIEMYAGKWLDKMTEQEYVDACYFIDKHFFYVYPDDEHDVHSINEKFRYLVLKKGVDGVLIDPFNQLDHLQKAYQREDQYLSGILKDIKRFALLNNVTYNIVAHPVKPVRDQDRSLPPVDMYDISGGAMWANKSDNIISYHRPNHHVDKLSPDVQIYIQKVKRKRTGGQPGDFPLRMNWSVKRFENPITREAYCNPKRSLEKKQDYVPQNLWKPYKDIEDDRDPF